MASKVIIVTGASRGIGLAVAQYLLSPPQKSKLIVIARSKAPLEELRAQYADQVEVVTGDLADFSLGKQAVSLALSKWGRLDGMVLNHGVLDPVNKVADCSPESWRSAFDVNFFSLIAFINAAMPELRKSHGRIIFTSSGAATSAYKSWGAYGASKAAMNHLALTLGVEEPDVTSISIRPGVVDTEMQRQLREVHLENLAENDKKKFTSLHKDGQLLRPDQPGHVMAKLVLEGPKELSGQFLSWNDSALAAFQES